ncbi:MAG: NUDIX domain-containing protein [Dongiaceae bacterium]
MADNVEILTREPVYSGFARIERLALRHRLHKGGWSATIDRELYDRGHVAAVLPYDPLADRIVLLCQFRVGGWATGFPTWQVEAVAGMIDKGETPEQVAIREAREEAGLEITALVPMLRYLSTPGASSETVALFCGRTDASNAGGLHGLVDEHEDIEVFTRPVSDIPALLTDPACANALTVIAMQWLLLNHEQLRSSWLDTEQS